MTRARFLIGLGSNRYRGGPPRRTLERAVDTLAARGLEIVRRSAIVTTRPLGPGARRYANAAILARTDLPPPDLLAMCKEIEAAFGRRSGRRWGDRILDLDLLLWSGGCWSGDGLTLPHPALAERDFVLGPLAEIAPGWRHPVSGLTIRQLNHHLRRNIPVDRGPNHP
ncbi:MAG: 2-amino-4-hydroxy-6-hydroxymethyldihydropteridine diphosphokinase [Parasphingopyxis sp.]|uniref:2-amino-4-hydroxy-6- hydroxymethyldihydropteridine diphosphokinase n=1 Tax=Parasphingopyxis sp. TaxID=1920299 RepID=UPI003FA0B1B6